MGSSKPTPPHNKAMVSGLGRGRFSQTLTHSVKQRRPVCRLRLHKCLTSGAGHLPDADVLRPQTAGPVPRSTPPTLALQPRDKQSDGRGRQRAASHARTSLTHHCWEPKQPPPEHSSEPTSSKGRSLPASRGSRSHGAAAAFLAGLTRATPSPRGGPQRARVPSSCTLPLRSFGQAHRSPVHIQTCNLHTAPS